MSPEFSLVLIALLGGIAGLGFVLGVRMVLVVLAFCLVGADAIAASCVSARYWRVVQTGTYPSGYRSGEYGIIEVRLGPGGGTYYSATCTANQMNDEGKDFQQACDGVVAYSNGPWTHISPGGVIIDLGASKVVREAGFYPGYTSDGSSVYSTNLVTVQYKDDSGVWQKFGDISIINGRAFSTLINPCDVCSSGYYLDSSGNCSKAICKQGYVIHYAVINGTTVLGSGGPTSLDTVSNGSYVIGSSSLQCISQLNLGVCGWKNGGLSLSNSSGRYCINGETVSILDANGYDCHDWYCISTISVDSFLKGSYSADLINDAYKKCISLAQASSDNTLVAGLFSKCIQNYFYDWGYTVDGRFTGKLGGQYGRRTCSGSC